MINPNKFKWNDTNDKLNALITDKKLDRIKLERACELSAYKIYPVYNAYNYEMGDKTPSLHYLAQIIFELAVSEMTDLQDTHSWAGITVESCRYGEEETDEDYYAINISFDLGSIWFEDIKKN
jgi:hypothetical protein